MMSSAAASLASTAIEIRKHVVRMHQRGTNVASAMSCADILAVLYFDTMHLKSPHAPHRDRFILSKGHAAAALYATLALKGFIEPDLLESFLCDDSPLTGHPTCGILGVEVPAGSLGHGLPVAIGMALAAKKDDEPQRVFVLMGDGEMQEGSVWEGAMVAARLGLDNVVAIVDANNLQGYDRVDAIQPIATFRPKFEAFGWAVAEVSGHDHQALSEVLRSVPITPGRPTLIIARTVKGKGVAEMEDQLGWHYFSVPADKVNSFVEELDRTCDKQC